MIGEIEKYFFLVFLGFILIAIFLTASIYAAVSVFMPWLMTRLGKLHGRH